MALCVVKISWMVFVLFSIGACVPVKQGQSGSRSGSGSGFGPAGFDSGFSSTGGSRYSSSSSGGSGSDGNLFDQQLASIFDFIAEILRFRPNRPFPREAWTSEQVPVRSVGRRPQYPLSRVVKSSSGYQRARDFASDAKYTQDVFDHMFTDEGKQDSSKVGSKGQKGY